MITGSSDEVELAGRIIAKTGITVVNLAGQLTVPELAEFLKSCSLYIVNDTGSMHIAAIMQTPLVAIFGPGYFKRYDPRNISPKAVVLYKKERCSPCTKFSCRSVRCLESISVGEVIGSAKELLNSSITAQGKP